MDLQERVAKLSPEKRAQLLERLREADSPEPSASRIEPRSGDTNAHPLGFAQQRLWFLEQLEPGTATYNLPAAVRLSGALDVDALERSLQEIQRRHESLRTRFEAVEGTPVQVIDDGVTITLERVDLRGLPADTREDECERRVNLASRRRFDLETGHPVRASLFELEDGDNVLLVVMHHIVSDAWSTGLFFRELTTLYEAFAGGSGTDLPELPVQYADYAHWQHERLQGEVLSRQLEYWKKHLRGAPEALELPTDRARRAIQTFAGATCTKHLPRELTEALRELGEGEDATLFMTLLAAFQTLLMRYSSQDDIVVGSPIAGRTRPELESLVGLFVNTLALRGRLDGDPSFRELLGRVRTVCLDAYGHQDVPFERLVEELQPERVRNRTPLFQTMLVLQNVPAAAAGVAGLAMTPFPVNSGTSKFDLTLYVVERDDGLVLALEHNTHLFDSATADRMLGHFETLLEGVVADPDSRLSNLPLMSSVERELLLIEWNDTTAEYPRDTCIQELFEVQAARAPKATALMFGDERWTFGELNERANRLAHYLEDLGVGPEVRVGICLERSPEMVAGLLAVLKAGGAFVPLDPAYPEERLAFMASDAGLTVLLTTEALRERLSANHARVVCLDRDWPTIAQMSGRNPSCETDAESLAYVIYTSGSTGRPKGVSATHRGAVNRFAWMWDAFPFQSGEVCCQKTALSFVDSVWEVFGPLLKGVPLRIIADDVVKDARELIRELAEHRVTRIVLVPSLLQAMLDVDANLGERLGHLSLWVCSGETLPAALCRRFREALPDAVLLNLYGSSEVAADVTWFEASGLEAGATNVPIGRPIANTRIYILDRAGRPTPIGVPGEIYVGGDGLSRGYWGRPDLTEERFVSNPFDEDGSERLFQTGDRARWRTGGNVEFLGRADHQVKIRGFRVELGEIENALSRHGRVENAVVVVRGSEGSEKRLVAYVVTGDGEPLTVSDARQHLRRSLPDYMIPGALVSLDALPRTPNGKIDRRALPDPDPMRPDLETEYVVPASESERAIADIWQEVLEVESVGLHDDFFDLGGHSLLAVRLFAKIEERLGTRLPLDVLFEAPTVAHLARSLGDDAAGEASSLVAIQPKGTKPPLFLVPPSASPGLVFARLARALGDDQPLYGLTPPPLDTTEVPKQWFQSIAAHYIAKMQSVRPRGPYALGGRCYGGFVAYEMAQQLLRQGEEVSHLILMDVGLPLIRDWAFLRGKARAHLHMRRVNRRRRRLKGWPPLEYVIIPNHGVRHDIVPNRKRYKADQDKLVWDANLRAAAEYVMRTYPEKITLLQSSDYDNETVKTMWSKLAGGGLVYAVVAGRHKEVLHEPLVRNFAEELRSVLEGDG